MVNNYRFLTEYINYKKRAIRSCINDKTARETKIQEIERIVHLAHKGYITLDETMRLLSHI